MAPFRLILGRLAEALDGHLDGVVDVRALRGQTRVAVAGPRCPHRRRLRRLSAAAPVHDIAEGSQPADRPLRHRAGGGRRQAETEPFRRDDRRWWPIVERATAWLVAPGQPPVAPPARRQPPPAAHGPHGGARPAPPGAARPRPPPRRLGAGRPVAVRLSAAPPYPPAGVGREPGREPRLRAISPSRAAGLHPLRRFGPSVPGSRQRRCIRFSGALQTSSRWLG